MGAVCAHHDLNYFSAHLTHEAHSASAATGKEDSTLMQQYRLRRQEVTRTLSSCGVEDFWRVQDCPCCCSAKVRAQALHTSNVRVKASANWRPAFFWMVHRAAVPYTVWRRVQYCTCTILSTSSSCGICQPSQGGSAAVLRLTAQTEEDPTSGAIHQP